MRMRRRNFIKLIAGATAAWQLAAIAQFNGAARAVEVATAPHAVMVYSDLNACNGAVLARTLVLTAAHCFVGRTNFKIAGMIYGDLYSLADVAQGEPHPKYVAATKPQPLTAPDIALLRLVQPLPSGFRPALLATRKIDVGDRLEIVGRQAPRSGSAESTESAGMAVFAVSRVESDILVLTERRHSRESRLGSCYGFSGSPVFAIRTGIPLLAAILRGGYCGSDIYVTPIAPFGDWLSEAAKRLGSPLTP
jgi:hypothetical protein